MRIRIFLFKDKDSTTRTSACRIAGQSRGTTVNLFQAIFIGVDPF